MYTFEMVNAIIENLDSLVPHYSEKLGYEANKYAIRAGGLQSLLCAALARMDPEKAEEFFQQWATWKPDNL